MPRQIVFEGHPDVGWLHDHWLFGIPLMPSDVLYEHQEYTRQERQNPDSLTKRGWKFLREFRNESKPMVFWMYDFIKEVEEECGNEAFLWTFQWHFLTYGCREESENAISGSPPYWCVNIKDFEGNCVHKNWSLAFDASFGDLRIIHGLPTWDNPFWKAPWRERRKWLGRVFDAIREHQRIRNFKLKRLGIEIPVR